MIAVPSLCAHGSPLCCVQELVLLLSPHSTPTSHQLGAAGSQERPPHRVKGRRPEGLGGSWLLCFLTLVLTVYRLDTQLRPVPKDTVIFISLGSGSGGLRLRLFPQMAAGPPSCGKPE